ncbi:MAG: cysteine dioxygenase family protein [Sphingomonas sp.]|uniref:cysteine dioxygenase n=1 Tax=Sphingomonas sp. TaxID=28214 RepID=UPI0025DE1FEE|nr:cysteine dioxygenase family protein [Sphingomonas sp.]MBX3564740.1 cysteine dioxygenase family protein [Sphingomonas sp.]
MNHDSLRGPSHLVLAPAAKGEERAVSAVSLLVKGQGTIGFAIGQRTGFSVTIQNQGWCTPGFRWDIGFDGARLSEFRDDAWHELPLKQCAGLDPEPHCSYWFSFDYANRMLRFGKGEMRLGCALASHSLGEKPKHGADPYAWLREAGEVGIGAPIRGNIDIWRDPVVDEVPLRVVPMDSITMDQMAVGALTVPANLTPTCQLLYGNVAGRNFELGADDFPEFAQAIKESIADKHGWCHKTLADKANEFGTPDPHKTYLRITMGHNQGESPGIPFVMEIWPVGNYSPIHNHGGSDAVIRVLHGAITVDMFPMLSQHHQTPFATDTFHKGEVTWISARLNQIHKLRNTQTDEPCITIQCYMYAENNETHWPYFDYLDQTGIANFDPNSDADYLEFKALMQAEYGKRHGLGPG